MKKKKTWITCINDSSIVFQYCGNVGWKIYLTRGIYHRTFPGKSYTGILKDNYVTIAVDTAAENWKNWLRKFA